MVWASRAEWKKSICKYIDIRFIIIGAIMLPLQNSMFKQLLKDVIPIIYPSTISFLLLSFIVDLVLHRFFIKEKYNFLSLECFTSILNFSIGVFIIGFFIKVTGLQQIMLEVIFRSIFFICFIRIVFSFIDKAIYKIISTIVFLMFTVLYIYFLYIENGYNGTTKTNTTLSYRQSFILVFLLLLVFVIDFISKNKNKVRTKLKGNENYEKGINNENTKN